MNNKLPEWRKTLNKSVENYQSMRAWYEENPDNPSAEQDMDAAAGEIEKLIKQYGVLIVLNLLDEIDELQERRKADSAEPIGWTDAEELRSVEKDGCGYLFKANPISPNADPRRVIKLYRHAPPAPVVPEKMNFSTACNFVQINGMAKEDRATLAMRAWNACRAAMLQAEPVSNSDELPLDYLQGHKDGLEWAAQLAEANHPQTGDWLYDDPIDLARAIRKGPDMPTVQAGNYPVTPDGWISCSERMPDSKTGVLVAREFGRKGDWRMKWGTYVPGHPDAQDGWIIPGASWLPTHWMPLPEPPQH